MRTLHRWLGLLFGLFMGFIAVTGVCLQAEMNIGPQPPVPAPGANNALAPTPAAAQALRADDIEADVAKAFALASAAAPDQEIGAIQLVGAEPGPVAVVSFRAPAAQTLRIDIAHGAVLREPAAPARPGGPPGFGGAPESGGPVWLGMTKFKLHHLLLDLHNGSLLGPAGVVVSILGGLALTFFAVSGLVMYVNMFRRRLAQGRKALFW